MSCIFGALAALAAEPVAGAEATATVADNLDARHSLGFQLGGSAFAQMVYRLRLVRHSYLEVGGAGAPEGVLNASLGLMVAHSTGTRFYPYAAAGAGFASAAGRVAQKNAAGDVCGIDTPGCAWTNRGAAFFYVRAGAGVVLDTARHVSLGFDLGSWIGETFHGTHDGSAGTTYSSRRIVWPMAGVSGFYSF